MHHLSTINIPLTDTGQGERRPLANNTEAQISRNAIRQPANPGPENITGMDLEAATPEFNVAYCPPPPPNCRPLCLDYLATGREIELV